MNENNQLDWWTLHVRKARGETLNDLEQRHYDAALARQDQEGPINGLDTLKKLRGDALILAKENDQLREKLASLEKEIQTVEAGLSLQTRHLLGVGE